MEPTDTLLDIDKTISNKQTTQTAMESLCISYLIKNTKLS